MFIPTRNKESSRNGVLFASIFYGIVSAFYWPSGTAAELLDQGAIVFQNEWSERTSKCIKEVRSISPNNPVVMIYRDSSVTSNEDCLLLIVPVFEGGNSPFSERGKTSLKVFVKEFDAEGGAVDEVEVEMEKAFRLWRIASEVCSFVVSGKGEKRQGSGSLVSGFGYRILSTHFDGKKETFAPYMGAYISPSDRGSKDESLVGLFEAIRKEAIK